MTVHGSCLCGAVRFEVAGPLSGAAHCHCSICRRSHGAAFASFAQVDPDAFRWASGEEHVRAYESSPGTFRSFCALCGSPLVDRAHGGRLAWIYLGTVDGDPGVRPGAHIYVGSKASWHEITDELPQFEEQPPDLEGGPEFRPATRNSDDSTA